jgi:hypothetical protein
MGRHLRGDHPERESIEQTLREFEKVCAEALRRKGTPGAKRGLHVQVAVKSLSNIWFEITGSAVPISLDTEIGIRKEAANRIAVESPNIGQETTQRSSQGFTSPGPRFCQLVLQSIDPDLTVSQIETAIRNTLGKRHMRKSSH